VEWINVLRVTIVSSSGQCERCNARQGLAERDEVIDQLSDRYDFVPSSYFLDKLKLEEKSSYYSSKQCSALFRFLDILVT
jgi:hypothetical protein